MPDIIPKHNGDISIATGGSRNALKWKNITLTWGEFLTQISTTTRTRETVAEYRKLSKNKQDEIKDVGGYVGGWLKGGRRKIDSLTHRSIITLDADFAAADLLGTFELFFGNAAAVYSTHKHTPENPRLRLIVPLSRSVDGDEYQAASRKLAEALGIDMFDDTTYQPTRLMYYPSTSQDGEYIFDYYDGPFLNPDSLLKQYPDWRDVSYWPESSRCAGVRKTTAAKQGNPLEKPGVVGAFCRCYDIETAISTFLADRYTACTIPRRYTYTGGSTAAGLVVYDDGLFAYSNHATDPASGRLCNAFDLVRLHLYGAEDADTEPDTPVNRLPSYTKMIELARNDEQVKTLLIKERLEKAREDFITEDIDLDWAKELDTDKNGVPLSVPHNVSLILENDLQLKGILAYNAFKDRIVAIRRPQWSRPADHEDGRTWLDADDAELIEYITRIYSIKGKDTIYTAVTNVAHRNAFHPVRDYLKGLTWDGVERLDTLLIDYLNADDTPYVRAANRKTLIAAVARVFNPGCKFDYMLTLSGPQGRGKSTFVFKLARGWHTDSLATINGKEAYEMIQGYWIVEMSELSALKKAELEPIKNFISKRVDSYRAAYGRRTEDHPRQCVFIGTTNSTSFLRDDTGNRRFLPVRLGDSPGKLSVWKDLTDEVVDQIWAEAVAGYLDGEELTLPDGLVADAKEQQEQFTEDDPRIGEVEEYLDTLLPDDWDNKTKDERREWIHDGLSAGIGVKTRDRVCIAEIWVECFGNPSTKNMKRQDINELRTVMGRVAGWREVEKKKRCGPYGVQKCFDRIADS